MAKTGKQIQQDVYTLLRSSSLAESLSGGVYLKGYRPKDSTLEDAIVIYTTGLPDQIQTGVVTINIYVPYIKELLIENGERCMEIETAANEWFEDISESCNDYLFELQQTIYTEDEPEISQNFVVVKLKYKLITD